MPRRPGSAAGPRSAPERFAAIAGRVAREGRWFADRRVLRRLGHVRAAIKRDRRPCPDDRQRRPYGEIMWTPNPWWCAWLYRQVRRERPERALELGTSLGMLGLYVLAALARNRGGRFYTIEYAPTKVAYARGLFAAFGEPQATCLEGAAETVLPGLLADEPAFDWVFVDIDHCYASTVATFAMLAEHVRPGGCIVFDDINFSDEMRSAWTELVRHSDFAWQTLAEPRTRDRPPRMGIGRRTRRAGAHAGLASGEVRD